jgi:hypothetical protein
MAWRRQLLGRRMVNASGRRDGPARRHDLGGRPAPATVGEGREELERVGRSARVPHDEQAMVQGQLDQVHDGLAIIDLERAARLDARGARGRRWHELLSLRFVIAAVPLLPGRQRVISRLQPSRPYRRGGCLRLPWRPQAWHLRSSAAHPARSASVGGTLAARIAGYSPAMEPTSSVAPNPIATAGSEITTGHPWLVA